MMRKCIRCQSEMKEGYGLKVESFVTNSIAPVCLSRGQGFFSDKLEKIKVAVCPNCGEIGLYIENLDKLKE